MAKIFNIEFQDIKERLCLFVKFTSKAKNLDNDLRHAVAETAAMQGYKAAKSAVEYASKPPRDTRDAHLLQSFWHAVQDSIKAVLLGLSDEKASHAQRALQEANKWATNVPDTKFLSEIIEQDIIRKNEKLETSVQQAKRLAQQSLMITVPRLVAKLVGLIKKVQEDFCSATVKAETSSYQDEEQRKLRLKLIRHVNDSTSQTQNR